MYTHTHTHIYIYIKLKVYAHIKYFMSLYVWLLIDKKTN